MKTSLKIISAFAVIIGTLVISDYIFGKTLYLILGGKIKSKQEYLLTQTDDSEIIFFGSSRAHRHYDTPYITDSLGIKAFNAGEDGRGLTFQLPLMKHYLENNHPSIIVLELPTSLDGKWNNRISMLYPLSNTCPDITEVAEEIDPYNRYYLKSSLFRYNSNIVNEFRNHLHPFKMLPNRGFDPISNILTPDGIFANAVYDHSDSSDTIELNILTEIINLSLNNQIPLVGIISPIYGEVKRRHDIDSIFARYNIPFLDNTDFRLQEKPNTYFKDPSHLNRYGARQYTMYVMQQLTDSLKILKL